MDLTIQQLGQDLKLFRGDDNTRFRLLALFKLAHGQSVKRVSLELGVVPETISRWKKKYLRQGARALANKPRSGRPPTQWLRGHVAEKIVSFRATFGWGAETIQAHLKMEEGVEVSLYRIHALLKSKGFIKQKRKKKPKKFHLRKVKVLVPGAHTQLDVCYVHDLKRGENRYLYNFVDHASRWSFKRMFNSYGSMETKEFMRELLHLCPFPIERLQTDNGIEFTYRFQGHGDREHVLGRICKEEGIRLVHIPPGEKELQGLVERHHRIDREQFFAKLPSCDLKTANRWLDNYGSFCNQRRRFKPIFWQTPEEYLQKYLASCLALILIIHSRYAAEMQMTA